MMVNNSPISKINLFENASRVSKEKENIVYFAFSIYPFYVELASRLQEYRTTGLRDILYNTSQWNSRHLAIININDTWEIFCTIIKFLQRILIALLNDVTLL